MARPSRPLLLLLAAAVIVGASSVGAPLLTPDTLVPRTRFTEGQFIDLALGARELPWPLHTELLGYPTGASFAPLLWPMLPVARIVGPTVALNLLFVLLPVFNAAAGWLAGRWLRLPEWGCFVLGGLCTWSAWTLNTTANGQLEQVPIGGAALLWAAWARVTGDSRSVDVHAGALPQAAPGLLTLAVGLAAPHVGLAALLGIGVHTAWTLATNPRAWRRLAAPMVGVIVATAIVHGYHAPQFGDEVSVYAPKGAVTTETAGPELPGVFEVATPARLFLPPDLPSFQAQGVAHSAYLGWVTVLAALAAGLRGEHRGEARRWWLVAAVLTVAALGEHVDIGGVQIPLPAAVYGQLSVALSRSANPYRLVLGAVVALSMAAATAVRRPIPALALVAAAWTEVIVTRTRAIPLPDESWGPEPSAVALRAGAGPVLDVPLPSPRCPDLGWHYATQAMFHDRPVPITLRFDWRSWATLEPLAHRIASAFSSPDCATALPSLVAEGGFTAVVLHADAHCPADPRAEACLRSAFGDGQGTGGPTTWWDALPTAARP